MNNCRPLLSHTCPQRRSITFSKIPLKDYFLYFQSPKTSAGVKTISLIRLLDEGFTIYDEYKNVSYYRIWLQDLGLNAVLFKLFYNIFDNSFNCIDTHFPVRNLYLRSEFYLTCSIRAKRIINQPNQHQPFCHRFSFLVLFLGAHYRKLCNIM